MRLRELRKSKNLSQEELGKLFNVAQNTISHWERGDREPDNETLKSLANYFGVTTDELLYTPDELKEIETHRQANESTLDKINKHNDSAKIIHKGF